MAQNTGIGGTGMVTAAPAGAARECANLATAVVIPAYQAEATIAQVVADFLKSVAHVIVVDDASTDGTSEALAEITDSRLHVIRHERNGGVGAAVKAGIRCARELGVDVIVKVDADRQMDPDALPSLLQPLLSGEADAAKGNRWYHVRALEAMPRQRRLGNLALGFLARFATGYWKLFDPTNGYCAWRAELFDFVEVDALSDRYLFEVSMLCQLAQVGASVRDVPIAARYGDETSHLNPLRELPRFAGYLVRALGRRLWKQYFVYDFNAVSALLSGGSLLLAFGVVFGGFHWLRSLQTGITATTGTVILAALPILMGFNLLLQALMIDVTAGRERRLLSARGAETPGPR